MQKKPREGAAALTVRVHAVGDGVLDLQPHLVPPGEVKDDGPAGGGLLASFCGSDYGVAVTEQAYLQSPTGDCQVEVEDVGSVDGGCVDAPERVEVALLVGQDVWERNG